MKRLLLIIVLLSASAFAGTCGNGYTYSRKFSIDFAKVPNTDQTNFPVAVSFNGAALGGSHYLPDLKTVANGGQIQNTAANSNSVTGPADLIFCDASASGNSLKYEVPFYDATTGAMEAYVSIPTVSHTVGTDFWIFYGNVSVVTTQQDLSFWATANFKSVYHLSDGTTLSAKDSTGSFNGTITSATALAGVSDGGMNTNSGKVDSGNPQITGGVATYEVWVKAGALSVAGYAILGNAIASSQGMNLNLNPNNLNNHRVFTSVFAGGSQFRETNETVSSTGWTSLASSVTGSGPTNNHMYLDGVEATYTGAAGSQSLGNSVDTMEFGTITTAFTGGLDEVRVSSVVRSADWVKSSYNNESSPSGFSILLGPTTGPRVVQYRTCQFSSGPFTCAFLNNVSSGNFLAVIVSAPGFGCSGNVATDFTDTLGSTYSQAADGGDFSGVTTCTAITTLASGGANSVTIAGAGVGGPLQLEIFEFGGMTSATLDDANAATNTSVSSLSTGSATATTSNTLLICGSGQGNSGLSGTSIVGFSPANTVSMNINNFAPAAGGGAVIQFTGSGSKSCTFTYNGTTAAASATVSLIKYNPVVLTKRRASQIF